MERLLSAADEESLAALWPGFSPMEKLVLFKLMDPLRGLKFYGRLAFEEKYFLFCGFPMNTLAPFLEKLAPAERRRFVARPRQCYEKMLRQLIWPRPEAAAARP